MTGFPRGLTARRLIRALQSEGFRLARTRGSHRIYRHADGRRVVVAYHAPSDTSPVGTLKGMLADIGWTEEDLQRLSIL